MPLEAARDRGKDARGQPLPREGQSSTGSVGGEDDRTWDLRDVTVGPPHHHHARYQPGAGTPGAGWPCHQRLLGGLFGCRACTQDLPDAPSIPSHWDPKHRPCPSRSGGKSEVPTWRGVSARGWFGCPQLWWRTLLEGGMLDAARRSPRTTPTPGRWGRGAAGGNFVAEITLAPAATGSPHPFPVHLTRCQQPPLESPRSRVPWRNAPPTRRCPLRSWVPPAPAVPARRGSHGCSPGSACSPSH